MITLKLTHGLSHDNGYVHATKKHPYVEVEDEAIAQYCVDSGFFVRVNEKDAPAAPAASQASPTEAPDTPVDGGDGDVPAAPVDVNDDTEELEAMTVSELKAYAETCGIELGKLTKKADIINAIRKAEAE